MFPISQAPDRSQTDANHAQGDHSGPDEAILPIILEQMFTGAAYCQMLYHDGQPDDFVYLYTNAAFHQQTGLGAVCGKRVSEVIPGFLETDASLLAVYGRVAAQGAPERFETFVEALDEWFSVQALCVKPGHFLAIFDVITNQKRVERALVQSEARFRTLVTHNNAVILQIDPSNGRILDANEAACAFYGWSQQELRSKAIQDINQLQPEQIANERLAALHEHRNYFVFPHRLANGDVRTVEVHSTPVQLEGRDILVSIVHDITASKKLEMANQEALNRLRKIASRVPGVLYQFRLRPDGSSCFPFASDAIREIYQVDPEEVREDASKVFTVLHPEDYDDVVASIQKSALDLSAWQHEYRVRYTDGTVRWLYGNALPERESDGSTLWQGFITDITERRQMENDLKQSEMFRQNILDSMVSNIAVLDLKGVIVAVNEPWVRFSMENGPEIGTPARHTSVGENYLDVCNRGIRHGEQEVSEAVNGIRAVLDGSLPKFSLEYPCHSPSQQHWFRMMVTPLGHEKTGRVVVTHTDITERKQLEEQIRQLAFHDALTNVANRRLLMDRLGQSMALSQRSGRYGALIFLDLDNFKPLNDMHGHAVGDLLLLEVTERLLACVRKIDTVSRFGGDEFVVLLSELATDKGQSTEQAWTIAEKIRNRLAEPYLLSLTHGQPTDNLVKHQCSCSVGGAIFLNHEATQEDILKWADAAMYQAKVDGRNVVRFHEMAGGIPGRATNAERIGASKANSGK
jgi:diguanylate cyclase (GGDEF)-like protein/PAS domain S-box-containing protein